MDKMTNSNSISNLLCSALLALCLISCSKQDGGYVISRPYCRDIVGSKAAVLSASSLTKSGYSETGKHLCVIDSKGELSPLVFNFDIYTESDSLRAAFNKWVEEDLRITCQRMSVFAEDFLWVEDAYVEGGYEGLEVGGTDLLSSEIHSAKSTVLGMICYKDFLIDLNDGAVFDLIDVEMRFASADGKGICRSYDGKSWYYVCPMDGVIRKMHRSGDELVFTDINHPFITVIDFIMDRDNNICSSGTWTYDSVLFFADGSVDEWPASRLETYPSETLLSVDYQWYALWNYSYGSPYYEYHTTLTKFWLDGKELKFEPIWSGEDGGVSEYHVYPLSDDEFYLIGSFGRLKVNSKTDVCVYEEYPDAFPDHLVGYAWMADNGWGLIPKSEDIGGGMDGIVGFDAYSIYTFEHFYIPLPGGAGHICGSDKDQDIVYVQCSEWNDAIGDYDHWVSKIDIRKQEATVVADGLSDMCVF